MEQNNNPDELIEIKPDRIPEEEENDIKIYGSESEDLTAPVNDIPAVPGPEPVKEEAETPEKEPEEVTEELPEDFPMPAEPVEAAEIAEQAEVEEVAVPAEAAETAEHADTDEMTEPAGPEQVEGTVSEPEEEIDDFAEDIAEMENEEADMEMVEAIGDSIVQQVNSEIENSLIMMPAGVTDDGGPALDTTGQDDGDGEDDGEDDGHEKPGFFARIPWWAYMVAGVALVLIIMLIWVMTSGPGKGLLIKWGSRYAAEKITYAPVEPVNENNVPDESDLPLEPDKSDLEVVPGNHTVITPDISPTEAPDETDPDDPENAELKDVYNILLIGEENIGGGSSRGRSDLLMIATVNRKQKAVKLTSIMRDCLVAIPGHIDNRINVAYTIGGVSLLYETLHTNLGVEIDNYVLVNFDSFENIIDALGGVDVVLTSQEANYLNTTNYISKPEYRNVLAGNNHLNGNQALGYCRIRNVGTASGEYSDFGRTTRQRTVLNRIYSTLTGKNYFELLGLANKCLQYVTTDLTAEDIEKYVGMLGETGLDSGIQNYRIPVSGTFSEALLREMIVTKIDLEANTKALRDIIYGSGE